MLMKILKKKIFNLLKFKAKDFVLSLAFYYFTIDNINFMKYNVSTLTIK